MYPAPTACWSLSSLRRAQCRLGLRCPVRFRRAKWPRAHILLGKDALLVRRWSSIYTLLAGPWRAMGGQRDPLTRESYLRDMMAVYTRETRESYICGQSPNRKCMAGKWESELVLMRAPGTSSLRVGVWAMLGTDKILEPPVATPTWLSRSTLNYICIIPGFPGLCTEDMSDLPTRPPAPAPPLPPGWTEHKAPTGSYSSYCVMSHCTG